MKSLVKLVTFGVAFAVFMLTRADHARWAGLLAVALARRGR
jgi:hypothetical protein